MRIVPTLDDYGFGDKNYQSKTYYYNLFGVKKKRVTETHTPVEFVHRTVKNYFYSKEKILMSVAFLHLCVREL